MFSFPLFFSFSSIAITYYFFKTNFNTFENLISYSCQKILHLVGFEFEKININELPSKFIIIGSHTSIYDFIIGALYYYANLHHRYSCQILMKKEFEKVCTPILSFFDSKFKLIQVNTEKKNLTSQICTTLKPQDNYIIFIAPEGTRKCTENIRSGYWYIAKELDIQIIYLGIDFYSKKIIIEKERNHMETFEEDKELFIKSCVKYIPLYPERCYWTKDYYSGFQ